LKLKIRHCNLLLCDDNGDGVDGDDDDDDDGGVGN
jgi:hypothetical protein